MKGIILHGGHGTRLRPLTHTGPKQLIPIANKPMSQYALEDLRESGITDIAIVVGDLYPEKAKEYYGDGSKFGVKITYVYQDQPRGIAHAVGLCEEFVGGEPFVVYLGDNLLKGGISKFVECFKKSNFNAMVLLCKVRNPECFGVAKIGPDGKLVQLIEKPKQPPSNYALTGIYFFRPVIFDAIRELKPSWRGELEITEAIQLLLERNPPVHYQFVEGWWKDTGTYEDILDANRLVLDDLKPGIMGEVQDEGSIQGRVFVDEGAQVELGAKIRGPAIIGKKALIESGVYIGPYTSIGNGVRVKRGEIENSIIMDDALIDVDEKITDSIIGPRSQIISGETGRPRGRRFIVGDMSYISL
ncbi:MAG: glucose-1-phosphate thymidylyltransferase [Candidatus Hadarchaeales archaeon]